MIALTLEKIAAITGGTLGDGTDGAATVTSTVEFDSRDVSCGSLFVCIPGARVDGHDFAQQAVDQGAVGVLAARPTGCPEIIVPPVRGHIEGSYVHDADPTGAAAAVVSGMSKLARYVVDTVVAEHGLTVVGVTGSAGKTSTKDLIATLLRHAGETVAPPGSFNNEIGLPYTALRTVSTTDFLVAEMSARHIGNIAGLCRITPPKVGVVLNVGSAHLGEFGSQENIATAKGELVEALPDADEGGIAVLSADDPWVAAMSTRTKAKVIRFTVGGAADCQVKATDISLDEVARASFTLTIDGHQPQRVNLKVFGEHQVSNATAAAAVAWGLGMEPHAIAEILSETTAASANRMDVQTRRDGVTVINDSYNANPDSMKAGISALVYTAKGRKAATAIAVLGQMNELGDKAIQAHEDIAKELAKLHVEKLVAVGTGVTIRAMADAAEALGIEVTRAESADAASNQVDQLLTPGDVVLVKASYSEGLWRVAEALLAKGRARRVL